jgi:hypothetical protein
MEGKTLRGAPRWKATLTMEDILGGEVPAYLTARQVAGIFQVRTGV